MQKPVILTGLRSNNDLTLGNYFGGMLPIIDMAKKHAGQYQINMFIPDLHSFTTPIDHGRLYEQTLQNARLFVAAGLPLDNPDIYLYRQSYVPAHSELTWILDCFTGFGEMQRMTEFKDKSAKIGGERTSVGLFNYPVLMAADILLYNAKYIPVGDDQRQHIEYTRDIATRFNSQFGDILTVPLAVAEQHAFFNKDQGLRIKDLQNPTKKMSKSDDSGKGVIFLSDAPDIAAKKIMAAATDSLGNIALNRDAQPGLANLLEILALLRGEPLAKIVKEFEGQSRYGDFKNVVAGAVHDFLTGFQRTLESVDSDVIFAKLEASETAMAAQANHTLLCVQQAVGLRPRSS